MNRIEEILQALRSLKCSFEVSLRIVIENERYCTSNSRVIVNVLSQRVIKANNETENKFNDRARGRVTYKLSIRRWSIK